MPPHAGAVNAGLARPPAPLQLPTTPWLRGGHAQTIWPKWFSRLHHGQPPRWRRQRWTTPDADFIDCDRVEPALPPEAAQQAPLLVLFHGLEGSSASHYSQAFASHAQRLGWRFALPHFRGCSGALNRAPRAYHSGDHVEIGWMLQQLAAQHAGPMLAVGVSLGGNALLRWAQVHGAQAAARVAAVAAVSAPLDLAAAGTAIHQGLNRLIYTRYFLRTMVPKALQKIAQHPGLADPVRLRQVQSLRDFDDCFTAPLHGFASADDYYARCSAGPHLDAIRVPTLVLNALNDPFVPAASLPCRVAPGSAVQLWQPADGGHAGFPTGPWPGSALGLPAALTTWMQAHLPPGHG